MSDRYSPMGHAATLLCHDCGAVVYWDKDHDAFHDRLEFSHSEGRDQVGHTRTANGTHLPECPCANTSAHPDGCLCCEVSSPCICDRLRACEQRAIREHEERFREANIIPTLRGEQ